MAHNAARSTPLAPWGWRISLLLLPPLPLLLVVVLLRLLRLRLLLHLLVLLLRGACASWVRHGKRRTRRMC